MTVLENSRDWRVAEWPTQRGAALQFTVVSPRGQRFTVITGDGVQFTITDTPRPLCDASDWENIRFTIQRYVFTAAFGDVLKATPEPRVTGLEATAWWVDKDGDITFTVSWYGDPFAQVYLDPQGEWSHFAIDHTELTDVERQALKSVCAQYIIARAFGGKS